MTSHPSTKSCRSSMYDEDLNEYVPKLTYSEASRALEGHPKFVIRRRTRQHEALGEGTKNRRCWGVWDLQSEAWVPIQPDVQTRHIDEQIAAIERHYNIECRLMKKGVRMQYATCPNCGKAFHWPKHAALERYNHHKAFAHIAECNTRWAIPDGRRGAMLRR